jgi:5-methylcytosine-specific restriction enzyme A
MPARIPSRKSPADLMPARRTESEAERKRWYNAKPWRALRASFLREHPLCAECERQGRLTPATTVHHVEERLKRPDMAMDEANLEASCTPCHTRGHKSKGRPKDEP